LTGVVSKQDKKGNSPSAGREQALFFASTNSYLHVANGRRKKEKAWRETRKKGVGTRVKGAVVQGGGINETVRGSKWRARGGALKEERHILRGHNSFLRLP